MSKVGSLAISALRAGYRSGGLNPVEVVEEVYGRIAAHADDAVWIHLVPREEAVARARALSDPNLPLYGIPFAVKDNIDAAGIPTTAACPAFAYTPDRNAETVERLLAAGALLIGKTNLDQFATGLVGVRSPYGVPRNAIHRDYVPGGSSSGSAVALAAGLVSFSLGTDTAGSGRVPAAFNNIVGLKPTRGYFSTRGVVPACRTLDCVSVFALTCDDAGAVGTILAGFDAEDAFSRREASPVAMAIESAKGFRFGVPDRASLEFFGDAETPALFEQAVRDLKELGGTEVPIDFTLLRETAALLYQGPWVAERMAALKSFIAEHAAEMHPVTRAIVEGANRFSATDAFEATYRLAELKRQVEPMWDGVEVVLLPTAGTCFTLADLAAEPVARNTDLGYYTNFLNLLDMCATAVPSGFCANGVPFGVTLAAPAGRDGFVLGIADRLHRIRPVPMGATGIPVPVSRAVDGEVAVAVVGAHLRGLPLNRELLEGGAVFLRQCRTAPIYKFYELPGAVPRKPGLIRQTEGGTAIEVEVWRMPAAQFGAFVSRIPAPLGIGTLVLETGESVKGFLAEPAACEGARDISEFGGWRRYLAGGSK